MPPKKKRSQNVLFRSHKDRTFLVYDSAESLTIELVRELTKSDLEKFDLESSHDRPAQLFNALAKLSAGRSAAIRR